MQYELSQSPNTQTTNNHVIPALTTQQAVSQAKEARILGILSVVIPFIPIVNAIGIFISIPMAILGLVKVRRVNMLDNSINTRPAKILNIAGLILAGIIIAFGIYYFATGRL